MGHPVICDCGPLLRWLAVHRWEMRPAPMVAAMGLCVRCQNRTPEIGVPWDLLRECLDCFGKRRPTALRRRLIPAECFEHGLWWAVVRMAAGCV